MTHGNKISISKLVILLAQQKISGYDAAAVACLVCPACAHSTTGSGGNFTSLTVSPASPSLSAGQTLQMQATAHYSDGAGSVLLAGKAVNISVGEKGWSGANYASRSCAVLSGGDVMCWGNGYGARAVAVSGMSPAKAIAVEVDRIFAVLTNGTVRCKSGGYSGSQVSDVSGLSSVIAISAGSRCYHNGLHHPQRVSGGRVPGFDAAG